MCVCVRVCACVCRRDCAVTSVLLLFLALASGSYCHISDQAREREAVKGGTVGREMEGHAAGGTVGAMSYSRSSAQFLTAWTEDRWDELHTHV